MSMDWLYYVEIALLVVFIAAPVVFLLVCAFCWWLFKDVWR